MTTDLNVVWNFDGADPKAAPTQFGDVPQAVFNNFTLIVGPTFSSFATDLLEKVDTLIGPFMPVIEALHTPLPVISDAGTAYDLLNDIDPKLAAFVDLAEDIDALSTQLPQVEQALNAVGVKFGSFDLGGVVNPDLRDPNAAPDYQAGGIAITNLVANGVTPHLRRHPNPGGRPAQIRKINADQVTIDACRAFSISSTRTIRTSRSTLPCIPVLR